MSDSDSRRPGRRSLAADDRGVSEVLGAVLVFGLVIALLVIVQTVAIPQANQEAEFKHSQDIRQDMLNLRSQVLQSAATGDPTGVNLQTGMTYQSRLFFLNPSTPQGTLETVSGGEISSPDTELDVSNVCGIPSGGPATTKFVKYRPSYNEYGEAQPITYENSLVHRTTGGELLADSGQILIRGSQIHIIRTVGDVSKTQLSSSVDIVPSETGVTKVSDDDSDTLRLSIPTELSASQWDTILNQPFVDSVHDPDPDDNTIQIELVEPDGGTDRPEEYTIRCTTVGLDTTPDVNPPTSLPGGGGDPSDSIINPRNNVIFKDATIDKPSLCSGGDDCEVEVSLNNQRTSDVQIIEARFIFYSVDGQGSSGDSINPPEFANYRGNSFEIKGPSEPVSGDILGTSGPQEISIIMNQSPGSSFDIDEGDWFIVKFTFEDQGSGEIFTARYFVPPET